MTNLSSKTGFTPNLTQISLANNAATTIQNMSAYDGQMLTGFVYVDATTDKRAFVVVQVIKNGAGTYEVAAADVSGDDEGGSPIVTFTMSGNNLQATLPNFTGFSSAYIRFKLDAPALGAQFPLQVDGANVTLATLAGVQGAYKPGQAPGLTTGAAIAAGHVGEMFGTVSNGVGGFTYKTTTTTNWDNTTGARVSVTLNKGVYLVSAAGKLTGAGSAGNASFNIRIGGTAVSSTFQGQYPASGEWAYAIPAIPVIISSDGTEVALWSTTSGTSSNTVNDLYAIRIA